MFQPALLGVNDTCQQFWPFGARAPVDASHSRRTAVERGPVRSMVETTLRIVKILQIVLDIPFRYLFQKVLLLGSQAILEQHRAQNEPVGNVPTSTAHSALNVRCLHGKVLRGLHQQRNSLVRVLFLARNQIGIPQILHPANQRNPHRARPEPDIPPLPSSVCPIRVNRLFPKLPFCTPKQVLVLDIRLDFCLGLLGRMVQTCT